RWVAAIAGGCTMSTFERSLDCLDRSGSAKGYDDLRVQYVRVHINPMLYFLLLKIPIRNRNNMILLPI
ncbi:MAG: hypothetical protein LBQ66_11480, partial [Planctomycetaceae bacterium]|nr:hypothetical protein [Planctomycetaceae bacterium]